MELFHLPFGVIGKLCSSTPASILYKSTAGRYRPVSYSDGPITARNRFIKNATVLSTSFRKSLFAWCFTKKK